MPIFGHSRFQIWNQQQHPYKHSLDDFSYSNPALPPGAVGTIQNVLDWILAVIYPQTKDAVDTVGDLPAVGNTLNDYRVVQDDGDGKAAAYRWEQREGDVTPSWYKIYDMDWGSDSILESFQTRTQDLYVFRGGYDDLDSSGTVVTGDLGGQTVYGGKTANKHLTLRANSGDGTGAATGFVQFGDNARPLADSTYSLGATDRRFLKVWSDEITIGTITITDGSIVDSNNAIDFGAADLSTTGDVGCAQLVASSALIDSTLALSSGEITDSLGTISFDSNSLEQISTLEVDTSIEVNADLLLESGEITSASGQISFDNENLVTTGDVTADGFIGTMLDLTDVEINANAISVTTLDTDLDISANGTGIIRLLTDTEGTDLTLTGALSIPSGGSATIDEIFIDSNIIATHQANNDIVLDPHGSGLIESRAGFFPGTDSSFDLGKTGNVWNKLWLDGSIGDGTTEISSSVLQSLRDINGGVASGDTIFWDGSKWVSSSPDTEVDHGSISGLGDDDHTQYALLAGRSGGQVLIGGSASGNDLTLESTSNVTKGSILFRSNLEADTDASYAGGWLGTDIGGASNRFRDVHTAGEFFGFRLENVGSLPSSSSQREGRLVYLTTDEAIYADDGAAITRKSVKLYQEDLVFNGSDTSKAVAVSGLDARNALWILKDNTNNFHQMYVDITSTSSTNVTITTNSPLVAGTYRLIGME